MGVAVLPLWDYKTCMIGRLLMLRGVVRRCLSSEYISVSCLGCLGLSTKAQNLLVVYHTHLPPLTCLLVADVAFKDIQDQFIYSALNLNYWQPKGKHSLVWTWGWLEALTLQPVKSCKGRCAKTGSITSSMSYIMEALVRHYSDYLLRLWIIFEWTLNFKTLKTKIISSCIIPGLGGGVIYCR